jgi:hypothetical protein
VRAGLLALAAVAGAAAVTLLPAAREARAFPDHPPVAHTGGFGEPTCALCHTGAALNAAGGSLDFPGAPDVYRPGERYRVRLVLARGGMAAGGFQLAARCGDGSQAGHLAAPDAARTAVTTDANSGVGYAHQTADGTAPAAPGRIEWEVEWTAPAPGCGEVRFHAAANAANGDDSSLGDHVYARELAVRPGGE